jgi:hypothetical protein
MLCATVVQAVPEGADVYIRRVGTDLSSHACIHARMCMKKKKKRGYTVCSSGYAATDTS